MSDADRDEREKDAEGTKPASPPWDPNRDMPEMLANPRTSTAIALGLGAAALIAGGLWLAARSPAPVVQEQPAAPASTRAPVAAATAPAVAPSPATPESATAPERAAEHRRRMREAREARQKMKPSERKEDWQRRVQSFREARKAIQSDSSLNREQKRQAMLDLMRKRFSRDWPVPPPPPEVDGPR